MKANSSGFRFPVSCQGRRRSGRCRADICSRFRHWPDTPIRGGGTFEHSCVVRDSTGRIVLPGGIAVDASGNVYVAAYYLNKVLKFSPAA